MNVISSVQFGNVVYLSYVLFAYNVWNNKKKKKKKKKNRGAVVAQRGSRGLMDRELDL